MTTILIFVIIGILIGLLISFTLRSWWLEYLGNSILGAFVGVMLGFMIALLTPRDGEVAVMKTTQLECIRDNSSVSGSFFLGCGSVNGDMMYSFYEKLDSNTFQLKTICCNGTLIEYTDSVPRIEMYGIRELNTEHNRKYTLSLSAFKDVGYFYHYKIYVPKGSIKQNYVLDAE